MKKVLIINDSRFERMFLKDLVESLGYEVKTEDEYNGIKEVEQYKPDIVIANLTMGGISGDELIVVIKKKYPHIKCYISSCSDVNEAEFKDKSVDGIINTPAKSEVLAEILDGSLKEKLQRTSINIEEPENLSLLKESSSKSFSGVDKSKSDIIADLKKYAFCPYCGEEITKKQGYAFCPYCGKKIKDGF